MTLAGTDYLLRLSGFAVAFVGFSAVVVTLPRAVGAQISELRMYFVRLFTEGGLSLLPAALTFTGLADSTIWRLSSAAAALRYSAHLTALFRRRRRVTHGPISLRTRVDFVISVVATLA